MIKLSYYVKKRIRDYVIHVIMLALLFITLFPIGWMVFTSLKENNDILVGKIPFGHARNDCMKMEATPRDLWILTSDGGINRLDKKTLKVEAYKAAQTSASSFATDPQYIWVASGNRQLTRFNREDLDKYDDYKLPLGKYDQAKVVATGLVRDLGRDRVWQIMQYRGYENLIEFDPKSEKVVKVYDLKNSYSPVQLKSIAKTGDILWIGTDKVLLKFSISQGKVVQGFSVSAVLPQGPVQLDVMGPNLILSGITGAHLFDTAAGQVTRAFSKERVLTVLPQADSVYLGTSSGFIKYDLKTSKTYNVDDLFYAVNARGDIEKSQGLVAAEVSALLKEGAKIFAGSSYGRISQYDQTRGQVVKQAETRKGHVVVSWVNYIDMWQNVDFGLYLKNSFIICAVSMIFAMVLATMAAYALSRFDFPGNKFLSVAILATQMVPYLMFLIPIYSMYVKFYELTGIPLKGSYFGIIFMYSTFFIPFSIWILRGFFAAIPYELEEAARIDGCSPWQVFWHIVLPLAVPGIIATGVYVFLTAWDELLFAWVLTSGDTMTIPVGIRNFVGNYQNRFDLIMAASTVATLPVMAIFFLLQRYIVKGLTAGAVKG